VAYRTHGQPALSRPLVFLFSSSLRLRANDPQHFSVYQYKTMWWTKSDLYNTYINNTYCVLRPHGKIIKLIKNNQHHQLLPFGGGLLGIFRLKISLYQRQTTSSNGWSMLRHLIYEKVFHQGLLIFLAQVFAWRKSSPETTDRQQKLLANGPSCVGNAVNQCQP
jgi:hypothetical protein